VTLADAATLTTVLVMVGIAVSALEFLVQPAQLRPAGFYSWDVLRTIRGSTAAGPLATIAQRLFDSPGVIGLFGLQLLAALMAIAGAGPVVVWIGIVLAVNMLFHMRNQYGLDGSDQMQTLVVAALFLFHLSPTETGRIAAIVFIAAQAILSYHASGFAKAISPTWRSGRAVGAILNTNSYGGPLAGRVTHRFPALSKLACWGTLVFECVMPVLVFVSPLACLVFIASGVAFHAGIAATMGLNIFFWSFISTYPALYVLADLVSG
jgi:hypothetical protein